MQYVKCDNWQEAIETTVKLQALHDATINMDKTKPRIIDCPIVTPDGKIALSIWEEDLTAQDIGAITVTKLTDLPAVCRLAKVFVSAKTAVLVKTAETVAVKEPVVDPIKDAGEKVITGKGL